MNDLVTLNITPFQVYDRLMEIISKKEYGRYRLPNGEILPINEEFTSNDAANAQSRCKIIYILGLKDTKPCCHTTVIDDGDDGRKCSDCNKNLDGWFCPDNAPTHSCVYTESYDWCDHCGDPEERK